MKTNCLHIYHVEFLFIILLVLQILSCKENVKNDFTDNCIVDAKILIPPDTVIGSLNRIELIVIANVKLKEWMDHHKCSYYLHWPPLDSSRFINIFNNSIVISQNYNVYRISIATNLFMDSTERYVSRFNSMGFASVSLTVKNNEINEKVIVYPCQ